MTLVVGAILFWLGAWWVNQRLVAMDTGTNVTLQRSINIAVPVIFGVTLLVLWEGITRGLDVPRVLLPPPSMIWVRITQSLSILWGRFSADDPESGTGRLYPGLWFGLCGGADY